MTDPTPGEDEVVVEVCRCGICGSDLHLTEDADLRRAGRHGAGTRICRPRRGARQGRGSREGGRSRRHDAAAQLRPLRALPGGRTRLVQHHARGWRRLRRVFAGLQHQCVPLPKTVSLEDGALVEPMAVGLHGVRLAQPQPGARVLVIGAGPIGLAATYWARRLGAGRIAVTAGSTRRASLALTMGADVFLDPADASPEAASAALGGCPMWSTSAWACRA